jgi:hypothetical protein
MSKLREFITAGATAMAAERPDIFTFDSAARDLMRWFGELQDDDEGFIGSGGYLLQKSTWHDGTTNIEYRLVREVVSYDLFPDEGGTSTFDWLTHSALWNVDTGIDNEEE